MKLKERAKKLKTDIPAVFLALKHSKTKNTTNICDGITFFTTNFVHKCEYANFLIAHYFLCFIFL